MSRLPVIGGTASQRPLAFGALLLLLAACAGGPQPQAASPRGAAAADGPKWSEPHWTWVDRFGGRGRNLPRAVAMAADGAVYSVGELAHGREADERSWSGDAARELTFLARHAPDGHRDWLLRFGGSPVDEARAAAVAPDGTVLVAGLFAGELDFGAAAAPAALRPVGSADAFLLGVGPGGEPRWALGWGGKYADAARAVGVDGAGNVYVAGTFQLTADFAPGAERSLMTSAGRTDVFVLKLDPARRLLWARRFGGVGADEVTGLAVAGDGSVYFGGSFEGRAWEGADERAAAVAEGAGLFVAALAPDGSRRWLRSFDAEGGASLAGLAVGAAGGVYAGGAFQRRLRFAAAPVLASPGSGAFAALLDARGELVWIRDVGAEATPSLTVSAVAATAEGLLLGGSFRGSVDFDSGPARTTLEAEGATGFLAALDAGGRLRRDATPARAALGRVLGISAHAAGGGVVIGLSQPGGEEQRAEAEGEAERDRQEEAALEEEARDEEAREEEAAEDEGSEIVMLGFAASHRGAEVQHP